MDKKPTIAELEKILDGPPVPVQIMPDGSLQAKETSKPDMKERVRDIILMSCPLLISYNQRNQAAAEILRLIDEAIPERTDEPYKPNDMGGYYRAGRNDAIDELRHNLGLEDK